MADKDVAIRVEPDDPQRCQAMTANGQCDFKSLDGSTLCFRHERKPAQIEKKKLNNYLLGKYYQRAAEMGNSSEIKSLKDEIGLLRMLLERVLSPIESDTDLMVAMPQIADLIARIEKIVLTSHKLEMQMGTLMGKDDVIIIANQMVQIIAKHVSDETVVKTIADDIAISLESKEMV